MKSTKGFGRKGEMNHGIHRIHEMVLLAVAVLGMSLAAFAADPGIAVSARQRYPWNELVDLHFTITGDAGTKYDTSFTAKDMMGNTNIAMRTVRKSDGTAANMTKEQLLPGTYNWVWDAAADLKVDSIAYDSFVSTNNAVLFRNRSLSAVSRYSVAFGGTSIPHITRGASIVKADGAGKALQFQHNDGAWLKCVCVHLEQSGNDITGYVKWARYMSGAYDIGTDFDGASYSTMSVAASNDESGYGVANLFLSYPNPRVGWRSDRVRVVVSANGFYSVKFNANGGSGTMANESFTYGTARVLMPNAFTRTGYTFEGWATSASGAKVYNDKQSVSNLTQTSGAVVNLYAVWKVVRGKVQLWEGGPHWAETNIGALRPEDYGYYFGWGDTTGYRPTMVGTTLRFNFNFSTDNSTIYTYDKSVTELQSAGWVTSAGVLAPSHDAAHVLWGGNWRMPTGQELCDLNDKCDWTWTTTNGVKGYIVRGRGSYASNSIFLPAAGYGIGVLLFDSGSCGYYWSSAPYTNDSHNSRFLHFTSSHHYKDYKAYSCFRGYGQSVRPVQ